MPFGSKFFTRPPFCRSSQIFFRITRGFIDAGISKSEYFTFLLEERNEWRVWVSKSCQMTISHPKRLKNTLQISPNCCYHYGLHCVCLTSSSMVSFHCRIRKKLISLLRLFKISFDLSFEPFLFIIFWMWSNVISIYPFVVFVGLKTFHKCVH